MGFFETVLAIVVALLFYKWLMLVVIRLDKPPRLTAAELDEKLRRDLGH